MERTATSHYNVCNNLEAEITHITYFILLLFKSGEVGTEIFFKEYFTQPINFLTAS